METITFQLSTANMKRLVDATCLQCNYTGENGETRPQFAKRMWKERMMETVKNIEDMQKRAEFEATILPTTITII